MLVRWIALIETLVGLAVLGAVPLLVGCYQWYWGTLSLARALWLFWAAMSFWAVNAILGRMWPLWLRLLCLVMVWTALFFATLALTPEWVDRIARWRVPPWPRETLWGMGAVVAAAIGVSSEFFDKWLPRLLSWLDRMLLGGLGARLLRASWWLWGPGLGLLLGAFCAAVVVMAVTLLLMLVTEPRALFAESFDAFYDARDRVFSRLAFTSWWSWYFGALALAGAAIGGRVARDHAATWKLPEPSPAADQFLASDRAKVWGVVARNKGFLIACIIAVWLGLEVGGQGTGILQFLFAARR
jgi:hypothetical protein